MSDTTIYFKKAKETKGTVVFEQIEQDGTECFAPVIRTLYLAKHSPLARVERITAVLSATA